MERPYVVGYLLWDDYIVEPIGVYNTQEEAEEEGEERELIPFDSDSDEEFTYTVYPVRRYVTDLELKTNEVVDRALVLVKGIQLGQRDHLDYDIGRLTAAVKEYDALLD